MDDEKIIDLYWEREQRAIEETDNKYHSYCHSISWNILQDRQDCEECVNDTWFRAWNRMPDERPNVLSVFLGTITRNLSLDYYRKKHTRKRGGGQIGYVYEELEECIAQNRLEEEVEARELSEAINRFVRELKKEQRVMFVMRYWYMDSVEQIAHSLGVSQGKVKSTLFRLRKRLKDFLEREEFCI